MFTETPRYEGRSFIRHRCSLLKAWPLLTSNQQSCCWCLLEKHSFLRRTCNTVGALQTLQTPPLHKLPVQPEEKKNILKAHLLLNKLVLCCYFLITRRFQHCQVPATRCHSVLSPHLNASPICVNISSIILAISTLQPVGVMWRSHESYVLWTGFWLHPQRLFMLWNEK